MVLSDLNVLNFGRLHTHSSLTIHNITSSYLNEINNIDKT